MNFRQAITRLSVTEIDYLDHYLRVSKCFTKIGKPGM